VRHLSRAARKGAATHARRPLRAEAEVAITAFGALAATTMNSGFSDRLGHKLRTLLVLIDAGAVRPDPFELLWAAGVCKDAGELHLARELERVARQLLPNLSKDLS
jgi:hypothetical protein